MEKVKEVVHKAKDAVTGGHSSSSDAHPTTKPSTHEGPHSSGLANQADPRVDSDRDASRNAGAATHGTTTGTHGTHGTTGTTGGLTGHSTTGTHGTHGTHGTTGTTGGLTGHSTTGTHGTHGTHGTTGTTGGLTGHSTTGHSTDPHPTTQPSSHVGPHSSGLANQLDPRVDSDRDASRNAGAASHGNVEGYGTTGTSGGLHGTTGGLSGHSTTGTHGTTGTTGGLTGGLTGHSTTGHSSSAHPTTQPSSHVGPHSSGLANQVDPRVDSDRDASRTLPGGNTGTTGGYGNDHVTGTHGTHGTTGTTGGLTGHSTTGTHGTHGATGGAYGAQDPSSAHPTTKPSTHVGPHSSGILNQLDPRVDSDRDASKNLGLNKDQSHNTYSHESSVPDASKHTPTEFARMTGGVDPEVRHAGDPSDHRRRHSLKPSDTAGTLDNYGSGR